MNHKKLIFFISYFILFNLQVFAQADSVMIDLRDKQQYKIVKIEETLWMQENLAFKTALSFGMPDTLKLLKPNFRGRWYHMNEIDSICPSGWRLPKLEDWISYFNHLSSISEGSYKLKTLKDTYNLSEFDQYFDLFENGNPLQIVGAGIYQGDKFLYAPHSADYWIMDLATRNKVEKGKFKLVKRSFPSTAHIHLYNQYTNIHSHNFNLEPDKPYELRRFLCRCVKDK